MVVPCPLILNPSVSSKDLLTPLSGRGRKDGGREESGDAQGSPSGNPQVSPTKPSSVIGSTLARIVRGPGSVPGWGLGNVVTAVGIFESPPPRGVLNSLPYMESLFFWICLRFCL